MRAEGNFRRAVVVVVVNGDWRQAMRRARSPTFSALPAAAVPSTSIPPY